MGLECPPWYTSPVLGEMVRSSSLNTHWFPQLPFPSTRIVLACLKIDPRRARSPSRPAGALGARPPRLSSFRRHQLADRPGSVGGVQVRRVVVESPSAGGDRGGSGRGRGRWRGGCWRRDWRQRGSRRRRLCLSSRYRPRGQAFAVLSCLSSTHGNEVTRPSRTRFRRSSSPRSPVKSCPSVLCYSNTLSFLQTSLYRDAARKHISAPRRKFFNLPAR